MTTPIHGPSPDIASIIAEVDERRLKDMLSYLAGDLPCRTVNHRRAGQRKSTIEEADDYIKRLLASWGYAVETEASLVQAFRCDPSKPKAQQYSPALPDDPWYEIHDLFDVWDFVKPLTPFQPSACVNRRHQPDRRPKSRNPRGRNQLNTQNSKLKTRRVSAIPPRISDFRPQTSGRSRPVNKI